VMVSTGGTRPVWQRRRAGWAAGLAGPPGWLGRRAGGAGRSSRRAAALPGL